MMLLSLLIYLKSIYYNDENNNNNYNHDEHNQNKSVQIDPKLNHKNRNNSKFSFVFC